MKLTASYSNLRNTFSFMTNVARGIHNCFTNVSFNTKYNNFIFNNFFDLLKFYNICTYFDLLVRPLASYVWLKNSVNSRLKMQIYVNYSNISRTESDTNIPSII